MSSPFAVLLSAHELAPAYRWRLVTTLFAQRRSLIEGSLAVALVDLVCWQRTGAAGFLATAMLVVLVTLARLGLSWAFFHRSRPEEAAERRTPEFWAWMFVVGGVCTASIWAATNIGVFYRHHDATLQTFVVMVEAGWVSASSARNAPSPISVTLQTCCTAVSVCVCAALFGVGLNRLIAPFSFIMMSAALSMAAYVREQMAQTLLTEQRLAEANARLTELSATDGLTGIGNRRAFDATLQTEWGRAVRDHRTLGLLIIDVDYFKLFNDRYGHPAGDDCLRLIAEVIERTLRRPPDFAARFGGEEFVALLPGTPEAGALEVGGRVCQAVADCLVGHLGSPLGHVTVSIGAASVVPGVGDDSQELIELADKALYRAKQSGRNRVCGTAIAPPHPGPAIERRVTSA